MPLFEEIPHSKKSTDTQTNQTDNQKNQTPKPPEESGIIKTIGQLLPFAPLVFEQFTGQKLPAMSGTMADIQFALTNLQTSLQTVVQNQTQLAQRIVNLETNASQQLSNLTQSFQSFRLTHTRERKEIEYNPNPNKITEESY